MRGRAALVSFCTCAVTMGYRCGRCWPLRVRVLDSRGSLFVVVVVGGVEMLRSFLRAQQSPLVYICESLRAGAIPLLQGHRDFFLHVILPDPLKTFDRLTGCFRTPKALFLHRCGVSPFILPLPRENSGLTRSPARRVILWKLSSWACERAPRQGTQSGGWCCFSCCSTWAAIPPLLLQEKWRKDTWLLKIVKYFHYANPIFF
ncbi:hypothetical protein TcCL_ESM09127, partial [Trypanosoma cruzi]